MRFLLAILCMLVPLRADEPSPQRIREAAGRALSLIQRSEKAWYTKQSCFSCHHQVFPGLAFRAAREHGIAVDEDAAHANAAASFDFYSNLERAVEYTHVIDPALNDGYSLIAADALGVRPSLVTAVYARLIAARQESDGHWETVDNRPPASYSPFTATAISLHAVQLYAHPSLNADAEARAVRAREWLLSHNPKATEDRVYQLLGAWWAGADEAARKQLASRLLATQQSDGGWNSLDGRASDAYSTGQVLYVLHEAGRVPVSDAAWRKGIRYLLKTQAKDGSWHVVSRLHPPAPVSPTYFETDHPYGHDQFISLMGENLAVMALASALGPGTPKPLHLDEAEPKDVEPWAETLLFGNAGDVKKLLDSGFDPNSAMQKGGVTALMLAAPDAEKIRLLLDRGADPNLRAKNRFSALLVAAQYRGSAATMNLLLDAGAKLQLPKGEGAPFFNAFPTFLAAAAGNTEIIARLQKEGDKIDARMNLLGTAPITPLMYLATSYRADSVRALLDAGARVDEFDGDAMTPLAWAAIANRVDLARLLIERGADVDHFDDRGMTPLLYAASIDFGDPAMIDLLLESGAQADIRNPDGMTALDLARKYRHTHLVPSLERGMRQAGKARSSTTAQK